MSKLMQSRQPCYRHPWPWILMAGPAVVVVPGIITAWIAASTHDGLVAHDYYKQGLAATAQSLATVMPVETLKAVVTQIPVGTLEALPSMAPSLEALGTGMPDFQGYFDPQGTPVFEWKGVPVMPQATAGQEFPEGSTYSYKVDATVKEVQDYYNTELEKLGWTSTFNSPVVKT